MKHVWAASTVERGRSGREVHAWACEKAAGFEAATGVKWSWHTAHGKYIFNPCMTQEDSKRPVVYDHVAVIATWLNQENARHLVCKSLLEIAEGTKLSLQEVCTACWHMMRACVVSPEVDRMGKAVAVKLTK